MVLDAIWERESRLARARANEAGLITSAIYNTLRTKPTDKVWQPKDFVKAPKSELTPGEATMAMRAWMVQVNRGFEA